MRITNLILRGTEQAAELARKLDAFVREVTSILNGGVRLDNIACQVKTVRFTDGDTLTVSTRYESAPLSVAVLSARPSQTDGDTMSGNRITWSFASAATGGGVLSVSEISDLTAATEYVVTLAIMEA